MAQTPTILSSSIESQEIIVKQLAFNVHVNGNTVDAGTNINAYTDVADIIAYVEQAGVQPTPSDTGANFPALDSNAAPSTVGIVVYCRDADKNGFGLMDCYVPSITISGGLGMTAGVVSLYGASNTGVTASGNLAFVVSCTNGDFDSAIAAANFSVVLTYKSTIIPS